MTKTIRHSFIGSMQMLAAACGWFAILALATAAVAQQTAPAQAGNNLVAAAPAPTAVNHAASPAAKPVAEEETATPGSAKNQGIKVHGHWVLQVKNTDGTLGERREFDNSLTTGGSANLSGDQILAALLSGNASPGDPAVGLISSTGPVSDPTAVCYNTPCSMITTNSSSMFSLTGWGSQLGLWGEVYFNPVKWVLSGNLTVPSGISSYNGVATLIGLCVNNKNSFLVANSEGLSILQGESNDRNADQPSSACTGLNTTDTLVSGVLTYTAIPGGPLAVANGQIIQITVTITFS
jgi:hypothetical protein